MNSRDPYSEDELDHLVRGALKARVAGQAAPDRVWERIKSELEAGQPAARRSFRLSWSPLAVQAALTLLLVMLGSIALLGPHNLRNPLRDVSPSGTIAYVEEQPAAPGVASFDDRAQLRSLKASLELSVPLPQADDHPPIVIPRDAPPNLLFSAGRVLEPEPSVSLIVKGQNPIRSGPYPWYR